VVAFILREAFTARYSGQHLLKFRPPLAMQAALIDLLLTSGNVARAIAFAVGVVNGD